MTTIRFSLLPVFILFFLGSCQRLYIKKAEKAIDKQNYELAIDHYKKLNKIAYNESNDRMIAELYFKTDQLDSSETYYRKIKTNDKSNYRLPFAITLLYNGKIHEAKNLLEMREAEALDQLVLQICHSMYSEKDQAIQPTLSDRKINLFSFEDYQRGSFSTVSTDIFKGKGVNEPFTSAYQALLKHDRRSDGKWIPNTLLQRNSANRIYDGQETYSKDGKTVYFTRSIYSKNGSPKQKIFSAQKVNDHWTNIEELPFNSEMHSVGQVCFSESENRLYFSSDMPGGFGGFDLYFSEFKDGNWSKPENLGSQINSTKNELFPIIDSLGLLCFASNQSNEDNLLDAHITYYNGEKWMNPVTINYPLLLSQKDHGFKFDSNNIKSPLTIRNKAVKNKKATFFLLGKAIEKDTKQPIRGAVIEIATGRTGELIKIYSDKDGNFSCNLEADLNYKVFLKDDQAYTETIEFSTKDPTQSSDFYVLFEVESIRLQSPILLLDTQFDDENFDLKKELKDQLDQLIVKLRNNNTVKIEIGSHTDQRGNPDYNKELTNRRSLVALEYLLSQGIQPDRIQYKGYGQGQLLKNCDPVKNTCSEAEHLMNRRIEYKVTAN